MRFGRAARSKAPKMGGDAPAELPDAQRALATAEHLVAAGAAGDAIRVLTEANRVRRDRQVEQRLVELRFDAFRGGHWPASRPPWPDVVPDLAPGAQIPEVAAEALTVEHLRSGIRHHGAVIVRGLIGSNRVAQLIADIDMAIAAYDAQERDENCPDLAGWYQRFDRDQVSNRDQKRVRGAIMTVESPPTMFDLLETFDEFGISQLVHDYFGEPPMLLARKCTLRRVAHTGRTGGWHQDGAFMGVGTRALNLWLALSHCGDDAPGLDVVGRPLDDLLQTGEGAFTAWATSPEAAEQAADGATIRPIFDAGDALIFDHLNLHRTAIDPDMEHDRYAIETWWLSPSTYDAMTTTVEDGYSPRDQLPLLF